MRPAHRATVEEVAHRVSRSVTAYVLGSLALSLLFGLVVFVTLAILGVPFALLIGLWVGLVALIPLVGGLIASVPTVLIAFLHSLPAAIVMAVIFVGFQLFENHFLYPVVMAKAVRMNPLWVLLAVLVGATLGGAFGSALGALAGAIIAIPVGGALQTIYIEVRACEPAPSRRRAPRIRGPRFEPRRAGSEGGGVDHEAVADVGRHDPVVGLVDVAGADQLDVGADAVGGTEVQHLLVSRMPPMPEAERLRRPPASAPNPTE